MHSHLSHRTNTALHFDSTALLQLAAEPSPLHTNKQAYTRQHPIRSLDICYGSQTLIPKSPEKHEFMSIENLKTFGE